MYRLADWLQLAARRLPFTLLMLAIMLIVGLLLGSYHVDLSDGPYTRWGIGYPNLVAGKWYTFVTSVFVTRRPFMLYGLMTYVAVVVGYYEWRTGSLSAILVFWFTNFAADLLALGTALLLTSIGNATGEALLLTNDAGASGGTTGVAGALVHQLPKPYRMWILGGMLLFILVKPFFFLDPASDIAHFFAFFLGYGFDYWLGKYRNDALYLKD